MYKCISIKDFRFVCFKRFRTKELFETGANDHHPVTTKRFTAIDASRVSTRRRRRRRRRTIYKVAADEVGTAFRSRDPTTAAAAAAAAAATAASSYLRRLRGVNARGTWHETDTASPPPPPPPPLRARLLRPPRRSRTRRAAAVHGHVSDVAHSPADHGSSEESLRLVRRPSRLSETSVETVPGQQRQLSAVHHPVGQGEPEPALEEPGEPVRGREPGPRLRRGTRPERGQREAGGRRERRGPRRPDHGRGRETGTAARGSLNSRAGGRRRGNGKKIRFCRIVYICILYKYIYIYAYIAYGVIVSCSNFPKIQTRYYEECNVSQT